LQNNGKVPHKDGGFAILDLLNEGGKGEYAYDIGLIMRIFKSRQTEGAQARQTEGAQARHKKGAHARGSLTIGFRNLENSRLS
jgi:hypothetical protein